VRCDEIFRRTVEKKGFGEKLIVLIPNYFRMLKSLLSGCCGDAESCTSKASVN
jgi:hypothetical protein